MNKFSKIATTVFITMGMVSVAHADHNWTGYYVGADAGVAFSKTQLKSQQLGFTEPSDTCNDSSSSSTFFPGLQVGYLHQFSNYFVAGLDANFTINTKQKERLECISAFNMNVYDRFILRNQLQKSVKARLGHAFNWNEKVFLPYLTAGVSFADTELSYKNEEGDYYSRNTTSPGWLIGAGVEWAFKQNWSLRAEYYYVNYRNAINLNIPTVYELRDPNGGASAKLSSNNVAVSLNYWI